MKIERKFNKTLIVSAIFAGAALGFNSNVISTSAEETEEVKVVSEVQSDDLNSETTISNDDSSIDNVTTQEESTTSEEEETTKSEEEDSTEEETVKTTSYKVAVSTQLASTYTGWDSSSSSYYVNGVKVTGFQTIDNTTYYFGTDGTKKYGQKYIDGYYYCFDLSTGAMKTGFTYLSAGYIGSKETAKTVYYDSNGRMKYNQQKIGDYYYCFDKYSGAMFTGFVTLTGDYHASHESDKTVYYDARGRMKYNQQKIGNYYYCFDKYSGAMFIGFVTLTGTYHASNESDKTVYYDSQGRMKYNQQKIGDYYYCFDIYSGAMKTGFYTLTGTYHASNESDKTVYYDARGRMKYNQQKIGDYYYCFDIYSGAMKTGFYTLTGTYHASNEPDKTVYYDSLGRMVHSNFTLNGKTYIVNASSGAISNYLDSKVVLEGIDISEHNGDIDLSDYVNGFVIIRVAWGTNLDAKAIRNMNLCEQLGIPYGVYIYSYALDTNGAASEANYLLSVISGRTISCGVWYDMEDADGYKSRNGALNATLISNMCNTFCSIVESSGYYTGIYASQSWFGTYINNVDAYDKWVANWGTNDGTLNTDTSSMGTIQQYTSNPIDKNVMYVSLNTYKK